jgi:hypothetical protein
MSLTQYSERDEGSHPVPDNPLWQESVLLHWYDQRQGIGGWHRIGHEANNQGGRAAIWSFLFDRAGAWQYRRCGEVTLTAQDKLPSGFRAGPALKFEFKNDAAQWDVNDGPLSAHIECRNFYPLVDPFPLGDELAAKRFPNHFEVAGRVSGTVCYDGRELRIEGFGYRDHSWGQRDWENGMLNHRWFTGVLGDNIAFAAITGQAATGRLVRVGYLWRGGRVIPAKQVDVIAYIEPDGLTHRGGQLRLTLPDDEEFHVRFAARAGVAFQRGTVVMVEMMCEAEGHGLKGYCDGEISTNPRNGKGPIMLALNAVSTDGFSKYVPLNLPV